MPFTPTSELNPSPDIRIFFSGLLILQPVNDDACQIFVNSSAPRHHLTIEVRRKREGRPDEIMMRHIGPLAFVENGPAAIHGMTISKVIPPGGEKGVRAFDPHGDPPDGAPDRLNLAIDMQSQLHPDNRVVDVEPGPNPENPIVRRLLDIDPLGGRPSILLDDGVLYTAAKVRQDFEVMLKKPDGTEQRMPRFAGLIGAAITLDEESPAVVSWRQQGKLEVLQLTKMEGVTYEIYIVNDPLFESDAIADIVNNPRHDEFAEYYKILHRVPTNEQFRMQVKPLTPIPERGSTRTPCMPVIVGGGD